MTEQQKEPWINRMALATVVLAVCATLSTFKGGGYSTQSIINQALASDQWAFYQARSTKRHLYELQIEQLELQSLLVPKGNSAGSAFNDRIDDYKKQVTRYTSEQKNIETKAREYESIRDEAKRRGKPFGIAVMFLQVAILLNSVAGLLKKKQIWWAAVPVGLVGVSFFANGFFGWF
jgi:hypothetical protein